MDSEVLKQEHCPPVVESRLLQPRMPIEIGRDAGAQAVAQVGGRVEPVEHFVGNLSVTGFVGSDQSQTVAPEERSEPVGEEEGSKECEYCNLADSRPGWQPRMRFLEKVRSLWFQASFHFQQFSNRRAAAC